MMRILTSIFACFMLLSGCSSVDINRLSGDGRSILSSIEMPAPTTRLEQFFSRSFNEYRSYNEAGIEYKLSYRLAGSSSGSVSSSDLRAKDMTLNYELTDISTGEIADSGAITAKATSGAVSGFYPQDMSELQADERLARLLGQRLGQLLYTRLNKKTKTQ